jgi:NADH-quinone oxidoreductase subunit C
MKKLIIIKNTTIQKILPVLKLNLYQNEISFVLQTHLIKEVLTILKYHFNYQFKMLTCISGVDYPNNVYRFTVVYELLSLKYNSRIRVKILVNELIPVDSIQNVFKGAHWWECEIWDMFGIFFLSKNHLTRLLTDYGFYGYPLRKDFPLSGFLESRYNPVKNRVVYEKIELAQEYRTFDYLSPWEAVTTLNNLK